MFVPECESALSSFTCMILSWRAGQGRGVTVRERERDNPESQTVFISRAVKSEFSHCPEIISVFLKKIARSTESSPL